MVAVVLFVIYCGLMRLVLGKLMVAAGYKNSGAYVEELCLTIMSPFAPLILLVGMIETHFNK